VDVGGFDFPRVLCVYDGDYVPTIGEEACDVQEGGDAFGL